MWRKGDVRRSRATFPMALKEMYAHFTVYENTYHGSHYHQTFSVAFMAI